MHTLVLLEVKHWPMPGAESKFRRQLLTFVDIVQNFCVAEGAPRSTCTEFGCGVKNRDQERVPKPSMDVVAGTDNRVALLTRGVRYLSCMRISLH